MCFRQAGFSISRVVLLLCFVAILRGAVTLPGAGTVVGPVAGNGSLAVSADQVWTAASSDTWLTVQASGSGSQSLTYSYAANTAGVARVATIRVAGQPYTITQAASGGVYTQWGSQATGSIRTIAGTGTPDFGGDGAAATAAMLYYPSGMALDDNGNLYVCDQGNHRIRKISAATGLISTIAGTGTQGYGGDGGPATAALLGGPAAIVLDRVGNLYFSDSYNHRIRKIVLGSGVITTIAGTGVQGFGGDGGAAVAAKLDTPEGLALDATGNLYIADRLNHRVRKMDLASGLIRTIAGTGELGFGGDGGPATLAKFIMPRGLALGANGDLYVADSFNFRIRKIDGQTGTIVTFAGGGDVVNDNLARLVRLGQVADLAVGPDGDLYFSEQGYNRIRVVRSQTGVVSTLVGSLTQGFSGDDGPAASALLSNPAAIAIGGGGDLYIADTWNHRIRFVRSNGPTVALASPASVVTAAAGTASLTIGTAPGDLAWTATSSANWLTLGAASGTGGGTLTLNYAANPGFSTRIGTVTVNGKAFTVRQSGATVTTASQLVTLRGTASSAALGVTVSPSTTPWNAVSSASWLTVPGQTYTGVSLLVLNYSANPLPVARMATITVGNKRVVFVQAAADGTLSPWGPQTAGSIRSIAGNGTDGFGGDGGPATQAQFGFPGAVAVDGSANLYIADPENHRVRKVNALTGVITTIAGTGIAGNSNGGAATAAQLFSPNGVAVDAAGNVYIADTGNNRICRVVAANGTIETVAGTGLAGSAGDGGAATAALLYSPRSVAVDDGGNVYVADSFNSRIRRIEAGSGTITTVAGTGVNGFGGDGIPGDSSAISFPEGVATDPGGNVLFAELGNGRVRRVDMATGLISTVAGTGEVGFSGDGAAATLAKVGTTGVAVDRAGNVFLGDEVNDRVRRIDGTSGLIETVAGSATGGFSGDGQAATAAALYGPWWVALDGAGGLYVADVNNRRIRYVQGAPASLPVVPPQLISTTPTTSTAVTETFTMVARDLTGNTGLQRIYFLVAGAATVQANSCHGYYDVATSKLYLYSDDLSALLGPILPGTGTVQNSQCLLDGAGSSATQTNSDLQLTLRLTRQGSYSTGAKQLYLWVVDRVDQGTGWVAGSAWTVTPVAPRPPSLAAFSPLLATTSTQTFGLTLRDPDGATDIQRVYFLVAPSSTITAGSCHGYYDRATHSIYLYNDALSALSAALTPGVASAVQNSQCSIAGATSSATASGTDLQLNLGITRQGSYATGTLGLYVWVTDNAGLGTGWRTTAGWTGQVVQTPPTLASFAPAASAAATQKFSFVARDANGATDIARVYFLVNASSAVTAGSCHGFYDRATNGLYLYNDGFTALQGPLTPGVAGTIQNSLCTVQGGTSTAAEAGTDLNLDLTLTRQGAMATGSQKLYVWVTDRAGPGTGWVNGATWDVAGAQAPVLAAATPANATGLTQTFSITARDGNGATDIQRVYFLLNGNTSIGVNSCHGFYDVATNGLYVYDDGLQALRGPVTPGANGNAGNSNCSIGGTGSGVSTTGTDLQLNLQLTRSGSYATGPQKLFVWITDKSNLGTGWVQASTWTVAGNQAPLLAVVSPLTAVLATESFVLTARDANGAADISRVYFLVANSATVGVNGCHGFYDRGQNAFFLYNDSLSGFVGATGQGNGQCEVNSQLSLAAAAGNDLQVTLTLKRQGSYLTGARNFYVWVTDTAGAGTGWVQASTWMPSGSTPTLVSVTPGNTTAAAQSFAVRVRDMNGFADISRVYFLVSDSPTVTANSCHGFYDRTSSSLRLYNDALTTLSAAIAEGESRTVQNSQCSVNGLSFGTSKSGTDIDLTIPITRQGPYATGAKKLYLWVTDSTGDGSGWVAVGDWVL